MGAGGRRIGWSSSLKSITDVTMLSPPRDSDLDLGGVMLRDAEGGNFAFAVGEIGKSNNSDVPSPSQRWRLRACGGSWSRTYAVATRLESGLASRLLFIPLVFWQVGDGGGQAVVVCGNSTETDKSGLIGWVLRGGRRK